MNKPQIEEATCDWPGCTNEPFVTSGNVAGARVCRDHFAVTNGKTAKDLTPLEYHALHHMVHVARRRAAGGDV